MKINVIKRNKNIVEFNLNKIKKAINNAMNEINISSLNLNDITNEILKEIKNNINKSNNLISVEDIQEIVIATLYSKNKELGKIYNDYRNERNLHRKIKPNGTKYKILTNEFVNKYKHLDEPFPTDLGKFVFYRTYSRFLPHENRREKWYEVVARVVDYNCSLQTTTRKEAETLYDNIFHLKQFLSGRTFWVGGTPIAYNYPIANFNCSFEVINKFEDFSELFYLLMVGSGVGLRILKDDVNKLPKIRSKYKLIHEAYNPVNKLNREDSTSLEFYKKTTAIISIGDSKEGWVQSLNYYFKLLYSFEYRNIETIIINYDNVRPKGEVLKTFGGTASGHESLLNMFVKIDKILKKRANIIGEADVKLQSIDCLDIANIIGENVVVGGVRRTAEIMLIDSDDKECIEAKSNLYKQIDGQWIVDTDIIHRQMSNNSIYYKKKPTREQLHWQLEQMRYSGEPGWVNEIAGAKRRENMNGVNPCGEILLDSKGLCNLTTVNVYGFVDENNKLHINELLNAQELSARAAYRMACVELELPEWNSIQQRDKIVGCSLTGWQDMVNATNMNKEDQAELLRKLRIVADETVSSYSKELNKNTPILVTTVKPEGTLSQLPTVSSGVHYAHSPYYIRRVRINANDPLCKVCEELGYNINPEVGQNIETCTTKVIDFPCKAPIGITKYTVGAIEQLENYKMFMNNYVEHNCSITVHVREYEWEEVEEWVWNNWDEVVALSFLSLADNFYQLMPYESISKKQYDELIEITPKFKPNLISKYESNKNYIIEDNSPC